jgi:hypothetical protein
MHYKNCGFGKQECIFEDGLKVKRLSNFYNYIIFSFFNALFTFSELPSICSKLYYKRICCSIYKAIFNSFFSALGLVGILANVSSFVER